MSLIYVEQRDMYAAYFALDRIDDIPEQLTYLIKAKTFMSGAISLIKKKYTEGIDMMNKVVHEEELAEILKPLVLSYRAYGYFCTGEIENALGDYKELEKKYTIVGGDLINLYLCHGVLSTNQRKFKEASDYFDMAKNLDPKKIESTFYIALLSIISFVDEHKEEYESFLKRPKIEAYQNFKKKMIMVIYDCLETLEATQNGNDSCANLSFYIGLLKLSIGLENEAIMNFSTAIDKSEENMAIHFMWKGIALAMCEQYDKALNEFRIALSIEPKNFNAALLKGRCYLFTKEIDRAFYAFKDFIEMEEEESEIQYWIGNFFFFEGQTDNAVQAYKTSLALKCTERALFELTRCYIVDKNLIHALELLEKLQVDHYDDGYLFDYRLLNALKDTSAGEFSKSLEEIHELDKVPLGGVIFSFVEKYLYMGLCNFYLQHYE
jgi:tetratricopeptide (TPR) repeat protein